MQYRQLGRSGVRVSAIGLGTNRFGNVVEQKDVTSLIDAAIDAGLNLIDTSDSYGAGKSEETLGVALEGRRDQVLLATKAYHATGSGPNDHGTSRLHLLSAVEGSLRRLRTDYIDLYQMHRWDSATPIEETLRTLDDLVGSGKVRYIGASNFAAWQLAEANLLAEMAHREPFVTIQSEYHLLERGLEQEMIPYCAEHGVGVIPYFPLAGGFLTGKYKPGQPAPAGSRGESSSYVQGYMISEQYTKVAQLTEWAEARGHTMAELAHAWLLAQPAVCSVISGATRLDQLAANLKSGDWALAPADVAEVNAILSPVKG